MGKTRSKRNDKKKLQAEEPSFNELEADFIPLDPIEDNQDPEEGNLDMNAPRDNRSSFFGLLDRAELEYFKNAENVIATNALSLDEREPFVESLFVEANGKELKLATNQVCSKLFERMVGLANNEQLQQLAKACENFAADLAYQKFSSHCLEALFKKIVQVDECEDSAINITKNITSYALDLIKDKYGSHVLSTVILSLSGLDLNTRSKRSQNARKHTEIEPDSEDNDDLSNIEVSQNLKRAVRELVLNLVAQLEQTDARKLALTPESSPVIQALMVSEAELMSSYKLLNNIMEESGGFVSHCLSDSVGSHFIETVIRILPAKRASKFIQSLPLRKLAVSDNEAARYIVQTVLNQSNLPKAKKLELINDTLKEVLDESPGLALSALEVDFEATAKFITDKLDNKTIILTNPANAALYEKLSKYLPFVDKAVDVVITMDDTEVSKVGLDPTLSYVLQSLLNPRASVVTRRKLLNKLVHPTSAFAVNAYGSHIVDGLWEACYKLKFVRERIASELLKSAEQVKHSPYGKKVWKNWSMEKYAHRRHDWWQAVKDNEDKLRAEIGPDEEKQSQNADKKPHYRRTAVNSSLPPSKKQRVIKH